MRKELSSIQFPVRGEQRFQVYQSTKNADRPMLNAYIYIQLFSGPSAKTLKVAVGLR